MYVAQIAAAPFLPFCLAAFFLWKAKKKHIRTTNDAISRNGNAAEL